MRKITVRATLLIQKIEVIDPGVCLHQCCINRSFMSCFDVLDALISLR
jgi:hypothetical protein